MGTVSAENEKALRSGWAKADKLMRAHWEKIGRPLMRKLLDEAIAGYLKGAANLTGNMVNSFAAGLYIDGTLKEMLMAKNTGIQGETYTYAFVGAKGFKDWDSGETVKSVREYRNKELQFQSAPKGEKGADSARDFLSTYASRMGKGMSIVVVAAAPYAEYLANKRKLDVLTTVKADSPSILKQNLTPIA